MPRVSLSTEAGKSSAKARSAVLRPVWVGKSCLRKNLNRSSKVRDGRLLFPDDLIRAQQEWRDTHRALVVPRPRRATELRHRLLALPLRIHWYPRRGPGYGCGVSRLFEVGRSVMGSLPPDLERLRTLETWVILSLERVREQIAAVERSARPRRAQQPPAAARLTGSRRTRTPDSGISAVGIGAPAVGVHWGDCFAGGRTCSRSFRSWPTVSSCESTDRTPSSTGRERR